MEVNGMEPCDFPSGFYCIDAAYEAATEIGYGNIVALNPDGTERQTSADTVARLGARLEIFGSDSIVDLVPGTAPTFCRADICVHYIRKCDLKQLTCSFSVGAQTAPARDDFIFEADDISIRGYSREGLSAALDAIRVVASDAHETVRLSDLLLDAPPGAAFGSARRFLRNNRIPTQEQ